MKRFLILNILLILNWSAFADNITEIRAKGFQFSIDGIHILNMDVLKKQVKSKDLEGKISVLGRLKTDPSIFNELPKFFNSNHFILKDKIVFTVKGTGQVYELDLKTYLFERKDVTYFRGYNFGAAQFFRNDTLFSIGGAGFWMQNGLITYFSKSKKEWELYPTKNENPEVIDVRLSGYLKNKELFFTSNCSGDMKSEKNFSVHFFDFKSLRWNKKGILSKQIQEFISKRDYHYFWTGKYGIIYRDEALIMDPIKNELYLIPSHIDFDDITTGNTIAYISQNDKIYLRKFNISSNGPKFIVDSFSVTELIKKSTYLGKAYDEDWLAQNREQEWILGLVIIIGFGIVIWIQNRRAKRVVFDVIDKHIIKALMEKAKGDFLNANDINDLLNIGGKSYDNQRKIRGKRINTLNKKLNQIFHDDEVIKKIADSSDKRISNYYIEQEDRSKRLKEIVK